MHLYLDEPDFRLWHGDVLEVLAELEDGSVDCVVTSPPYWGLRDYGTGLWDGGDPDCDHLAPAGGGTDATGLQRDGRSEEARQGNAERIVADRRQQYRHVCGKCGARRVDQQLGLEPTPDLYVANMVAVFREVRRVLAPHGTCWVNLGDSYAAGGGFAPNAPSSQARLRGESVGALHGASASNYMARANGPKKAPPGLKPKDLVGIPWRVAFALQADGWYLRSDIIWAKPNPMPESVTDRPTKAHEYVFLLTKQPRYWFDQEAVREPAEWRRWGDQNYSPEAEAMYGQRIKPRPKADLTPRNDGERWNEHNGRGFTPNATGRNVRSVWEIATQPYPDAHFATYPEELVRRCILAGCPEWVCRVCGKPRERIVEHGAVTSTGGSTTGARASNMANVSPLGQDPERSAYNTGAFVAREKLTAGWSDCGHNDLRAGRVLDPFLGSGTSALVARQENRHAIGIELNEDYCELAARRVSKRQRKQLAADLKPRADGTLNLFAEAEAT